MIDHVIMRQRHLKDVHSTRAMRGTGMWSDHRLARSLVALELPPPRRRQAVSSGVLGGIRGYTAYTNLWDFFDSV